MGAGTAGFPTTHLCTHTLPCLLVATADSPTLSFEPPTDYKLPQTLTLVEELAEATWVEVTLQSLVQLLFWLNRVGCSSLLLVLVLYSSEIQHNSVP